MYRKVCVLTSVHDVFDTRIFHKQAKSLIKYGYDVTLIAQHDKEEEKEGIKIKPIKRPLNRFERVFILSWELFRKAKKENAEIYHFHDPELLPVAVMLKLFTRKKVIYDVHEHYPNAILSKYWIPKPLRIVVKYLFEIQERLLVPMIDAVIFTTPIVGQRYLNMGITTVRVENFPLVEMLDNVNGNQVERDGKTVVYVGLMSQIRGILQLITAFAEVLKKNVASRFLCQ